MSTPLAMALCIPMPRSRWHSLKMKHKRSTRQTNGTGCPLRLPSISHT
ncbi:hypothetical protein ID866_12710 [Astraeus odoratus]|nr:hypothetical protein ID866_12710 [Astraeus odoratus]